MMEKIKKQISDIGNTITGQIGANSITDFTKVSAGSDEWNQVGHRAACFEPFEH